MSLKYVEVVYPILIRVFYSNMEISATRQDRIVTNVGSVPIEFDMGDLNKILGIEDKNLELYTFKKEVDFNDFNDFNNSHAIKNICRHRDLLDDVCPFSFQSQLLSL